jgi:hypothetical protein
MAARCSNLQAIPASQILRNQLLAPASSNFNLQNQTPLLLSGPEMKKQGL